jgi:hypothetical protein
VLSLLVDFLVGESVRALACKHHIAEERVEAALRSALARYDFSAAQRGAQTGGRSRTPIVLKAETRCS